MWRAPDARRRALGASVDGGARDLAREVADLHDAAELVVGVAAGAGVPPRGVFAVAGSGEAFAFAAVERGEGGPGARGAVAAFQREERGRAVGRGGASSATSSWTSPVRIRPREVPSICSVTSVPATTSNTGPRPGTVDSVMPSAIAPTSKAEMAATSTGR